VPHLCNWSSPCPLGLSLRYCPAKQALSRILELIDATSSQYFVQSCPLFLLLLYFPAHSALITPRQNKLLGFRASVLFRDGIRFREFLFLLNCSYSVLNVRCDALPLLSILCITYAYIKMHKTTSHPVPECQPSMVERYEMGSRTSMIWPRALGTRFT
jgi:hypothetical protein